MNVEKDNTLTYTGSLSADYNVGSNLRISLSAGGSYFHNYEVKDKESNPVNDYYTINFSIQATIKF